MMMIMVMMLMVSQMSCDCYVLGSLPVEIGLLSGVEMLRLYNNQLSCEILDDDRDDDHDDDHVYNSVDSDDSVFDRLHDIADFFVSQRQWTLW